MYQANVFIPKTEISEDDDILAERDLTPYAYASSILPLSTFVERGGQKGER